jgi:hypothetical protein
MGDGQRTQKLLILVTTEIHVVNNDDAAGPKGPYYPKTRLHC